MTLLLASCGSEPGKVTLAEQDRWPEAPDFPGLGAEGAIVVTDGNDDTLSVVDVATRQRIYVAPVGLSPVEPEGPHHLVPSPDQRFLYVPISNFAPGSGSGPHGAHGTGSAPGYLLKVDATTMREVGRANMRANPGDILMTRDGSTVFVSHFNFAEAQKILADVSAGPERIAMMDSYVGRVRTADMQSDFIRICPTGHGLALSEDERIL